MEKRDDGGPAFPQMVSRIAWDKDDQINRTMIDSTGGLSLRDYFAGQVLPRAAGTNGAELAARMSYEYADAMLKERAK